MNDVDNDVLKYFKTLGEFETDIPPISSGCIYNGVLLIILHKSGMGYISVSSNLYREKSNQYNLLKKGIHFNKRLQLAFNEDNNASIYFITTYEMHDAHLIKNNIISKFIYSEKLFNVRNRTNIKRLPKGVVIDDVKYGSIREASRVLGLSRACVRWKLLSIYHPNWVYDI